MSVGIPNKNFKQDYFKQNGNIFGLMTTVNVYVCVFVCLVRGFSANDKIVYFSANAVPIVPLPAKTQSLIESTH